jgi:hypothetical protein
VSDALAVSTSAFGFGADIALLNPCSSVTAYPHNQASSNQKPFNKNLLLSKHRRIVTVAVHHHRVPDLIETGASPFSSGGLTMTTVAWLIKFLPSSSCPSSLSSPPRPNIAGM